MFLGIMVKGLIFSPFAGREFSNIVYIPSELVCKSLEKPIIKELFGGGAKICLVLVKGVLIFFGGDCVGG